MNSARNITAGKEGMTLRLRCYEYGDEHHVKEFFDNNRQELRRFMTKDALGIVNEASAENYIRLMKIGWKLKNYFCFGIWSVAEHEELVGEAMIFNVGPSRMEAEVGVYLDRKWRFRGVGKLAIGKVVDFAFSVLQIPTVLGAFEWSNTASAALFHSLGFEEFDRTEKHVFVRKRSSHLEMGD